MPKSGFLEPCREITPDYPALISSVLFFQLQLQTEPLAPAPQRLGSPVRGCILGIQLAKALCYILLLAGAFLEVPPSPCRTPSTGLEETTEQDER